MKHHFSCEELKIFERLLVDFDAIPSAPCLRRGEVFNCWWETKFPCISTEAKLFNWAYELFNNLCVFCKEGVWAVFKYKKSEFGRLPVVVKEEDVPAVNSVAEFSEMVTIYRGLSRKEHETKSYQQSWTIDIAERFAYRTYEDMTDRLVVKATIKRDSILHYQNYGEFEVVVKYNAVLKVEVVA